MKLTKFVHACVLVEDDESVALFDPGEFSWTSGLVDVHAWPRLDYVLITHEHPDHFYRPFIEAILAAFPDVAFYTTPGIAEQLNAWGAKRVYTTSDDEAVDIAPLAHEPIAPLSSTVPANVRFHYKGLVSHPGDSIHMTEAKGILFLPLAAPWEAPVAAVAFAEALKPKAIVPIHDWMWRDEFRESMYARLQAHFAKQQIQFVAAEDGKPFTIDL